jgi:hypothetical protein
VAFGNEPSLNFSDHSLSREIADDYLIAHLIELNAAGRHAALLSADGPAAFKAKLRGFRVIRPEATWLLPVEPTREERELQQLRAEKATLPKLSLTIAGAKKIDAISYRYHLLAQWTTADLSDMRSRLFRQLPGIPAGSRKASDLALVRENDAKIRRWTKNIDDLDRYRRQLVLDLPFAIWNSGARSAENVHVVISANLKATLTDEMPDMQDQDSETPSEHGVLATADFPVPKIRDFRLESILSQDDIHSAEMCIGIARQEYTTELPRLYFLFEDENDLDSFGIEWEIRALNIGAPVRGRLNVVVDKIPAVRREGTENNELPMPCKPKPLS